MKKKLPMGTLIEIKNKTDKYLIVGKNIKKDEVIFDYLCVKYPYGFVKGEKNICVNDEDITYIVCLGDINY